MKWVINFFNWVRRYQTNQYKPTKFSKQHYKNFEEAVKVSDVHCYVYDEQVRGSRLILQGTELHCVTEENLVSFRKLNRAERRKVAKEIKQYTFEDKAA